MVIILAARDYFAVIFTSDKELQQAVAHIAYLLAVTMVLNSIQPVISGHNWIEFEVKKKMQWMNLRILSYELQVLQLEVDGKPW